MLFALLFACEEPEAVETAAPALHVESVVLACEEWAEWSADWTVVSVQNCAEDQDEVRCEASISAGAWETSVYTVTGEVLLMPRCPTSGEDRVVTFLAYQ